MTWQNEAVLYPDVELLLTGYLRTRLAARNEPYAQSVLVSNTVPIPRSPRMVIVRRDGGSAFDLRDRARVSVRVWSPTEQSSTDLSRLVAALLGAAPNGAPILSVNQQSAHLPVADESGESLRYSLYEITTRGVALT